MASLASATSSLLLRGRVALVLERLLLVGQLGDGLVELVGVGGAGAQRDPGELVALQVLVERGGVAEDRAEPVVLVPPMNACTATSPSSPCSSVDLGLLGGDGGLGGGDLGLEPLSSSTATS